jgi:hypothetical protein
MPRLKSQGRVSQPQQPALRGRLEAFDRIDFVSDEMRELIANQWPRLLAKLRPRKPS